MHRRALTAAMISTVLAFAGRALAQEPDTAGQPVQRDALGTRLVNLATPYPIGPRTLEVLFIHRFRVPVQDGSEHDLWGLDSGADLGLGLTWGFSRRFDAALLRASFQEDFELAGKILVLEQTMRVPVTLAVRAGVDRLEREGIEDPSRPFVQVLLARRFAPGINLLVSPSWVGDTPRLRNAFNVPLGFTFGLPGDQLLEIEVIPKNRDLDESETAWHVALSKAIGGHIFELVLGNSRAFTVDQALGGDSAAGFRPGDVRLGFNLIRKFYPSRKP